VKTTRHIFWLSGWAGTGKSTIAWTVAHEYHNRGCLEARFFFSRGKEDVSHAGEFFTSIATQLAQNSLAMSWENIKVSYNSRSKRPYYGALPVTEIYKGMGT
jgi:hypothetical protein